MQQWQRRIRNERKTSDIMVQIVQIKKKKFRQMQEDQQSEGNAVAENSFITARRNHGCVAETRLRGNQSERLSQIMCATLLHLSPGAN